jgi:hypothetical protein
LLDMTTTATGLLCWRDSHPLEWQLAALHQIMSGVACINEGHAGSPPEIRDWMSGNICRCGAYDHIVAAIQNAARVSQPVRGG